MTDKCPNWTDAWGNRMPCICEKCRRVFEERRKTKEARQ